MRTKKKKAKPKTKLGLPDLDQAKAAVLASLRCGIERSWPYSWVAVFAVANWLNSPSIRSSVEKVIGRLLILWERVAHPDRAGSRLGEAKN